jgi:hypothetical protein
MKIVINACFGGFSISNLAVKILAGLKGRKCFFFTTENLGGDYIPMSDDEAIANTRMFPLINAFDIDNPNEILRSVKDWHDMSMDERKAQNALYKKHSLDGMADDRSDPYLVGMVEELGSKAASGSCAKLKVVEIPDGIEWEISEYDGNESVEEKHQSWS